MEKKLRQLVEAIAGVTGVTISLGERTTSQPARMDANLRSALLAGAAALDISVREMPCGAGHDAALFANQGVSTAMIFIRNANGSHNPREAMDFADFADATRLLSHVLAVA
jgi:N-carbamoyl-L-amino-acid hydrolase